MPEPYAPLVARIYKALATPDRRSFIDPSDLDAMAVDVALELGQQPEPARQAGDRHLPPPYDKLSASERQQWLVLEGMFDGAITDEVRAVNLTAGYTMATWQSLLPEVQMAVANALLNMVPMIHAVALNPEARVQAVTTDG